MTTADSQVLWLDGVERKYIEEVGAMNIFFKIDGGQVVTPMLNGSILPGITRNSVLQLCRDWGLPTEERKISVEELIQAQKEGKLEEVFGTGTAAVISPVGKLRYKDDVMVIGNGEIGPLSQKLYDTVTGIGWADWRTSLAGGSGWTEAHPWKNEKTHHLAACGRPNCCGENDRRIDNGPTGIPLAPVRRLGRRGHSVQTGGAVPGLEGK